jgi:hypothetical protein
LSNTVDKSQGFSTLPSPADEPVGATKKLAPVEAPVPTTPGKESTGISAAAHVGDPTATHMMADAITKGAKLRNRQEQTMAVSESASKQWTVGRILSSERLAN